MIRWFACLWYYRWLLAGVGSWVALCLLIAMEVTK